MICSWCKTDSVEAAARHEGPHSTWCPHFREEQRGGDPISLNWRRVTIESDPRTGEIVISYSMPNGVPQVSRYPVSEFISKGSQFAQAIAFHVLP